MQLYGGYCPQFKYQLGETFGHTTSRLLRDGNVASSGNLVLANSTTRPITVPETEEEKAKVLRNRRRSWGNQKYIEKMIPGYSGFIPKNQHYFGKRYAKNCVSAIASFEGDQTKQNRLVQELRLIDALQTGELKQQEGLPMISSSYRTPLKTVGKETKNFVSASLPEHVVSPYLMKNSNPKKNFMSGYRGFVPCSRGKIGKGFPLITHSALNEFTDKTADYKHRATTSEGFKAVRPQLVRLNTTPIYLSDAGLVPNYTGHIPGQRYRFGGTFGESTRDSMGKKIRETAIESL